MSAADVPAPPGLPGGMTTWPPRRWIAALVVGAGAALAIGVPTGVVETSLYTRMTPVEWWNYPVWAVSAVLTGLIAATYVRAGRPATDDGHPRRALAATVLSAFAVGCPVCNKLVVGLLGVSGALSFWAPLQPVLGVGSVAILAAALHARLRGERACAAGPRSVVA